MENANQTVQTRDVYDMVTERVITLLEKGVVPWKQTWTESGLPQNLITGKPYRGINVWLLLSLDYPKNFFLTFAQAKELGGNVKKNEKGHLIVFWKWIEKENKVSHGMEKIPLLRYYKVFNVAQCEGLPEKKIPETTKPNDPIGECEKIVELMPKCPEIKFTGSQPYYNPVLDFINMPKIKDFQSSETYYETLFHELVHSTGHQSRLNRKEVTDSRFGSALYSIEELTAELGCCYLKSCAGLKEVVRDNNVAYLQGWLKRLRSDKKFIVYASAQAQRAVDFILNVIPRSTDEPMVEEVLS